MNKISKGLSSILLHLGADYRHSHVFHTSNKKVIISHIIFKGVFTKQYLRKENFLSYILNQDQSNTAFQQNASVLFSHGELTVTSVVPKPLLPLRTTKTSSNFILRFS